MAVNTDNLDEVVNQLAKMERAVELEIIREARKRMRAIMRSLMPAVKGVSPVNTGALKKSVKVQGRSRRGVSTVKLIWRVMYAGPINFKKGNKSEKFATDFWNQKKEQIDQDGAAVVKQVFKEVLENYGAKVVK